MKLADDHLLAHGEAVDEEDAEGPGVGVLAPCARDALVRVPRDLADPVAELGPGDVLEQVAGEGDVALRDAEACQRPLRITLGGDLAGRRAGDRVGPEELAEGLAKRFRLEAGRDEHEVLALVTADLRRELLDGSARCIEPGVSAGDGHNPMLTGDDIPEGRGAF